MIKNNGKKIIFMVVLVFFWSILQSQELNKAKIKIKKVLVTKVTKTIIEENEEFVLLKKQYTQFDNKGRFVFKLKNNYGHKTYINYKSHNIDEFLIYRGLKKGDKIITSILINIGNDVIKGKFISKESKVSVLVMQKERRYGKYIIKKIKKKPSKKVKYEFEIGLGFSKNEFKEFYLKDKAQEELIKQYANINSLSHTSSGTYPEIGSFTPISLGINYLISKDLYIKGGIEFASASAISAKEFGITWTGFNENYKYEFSHKVSYFLPYIGIEKRFNDFGIFINAGLNKIKYDYKMSSTFSEQDYNENTTDIINGSGSSFSMILGIKYKKRIFSRLHGIIKLEYLLSKISSITAERTLSGTNSEGETVSENDSGLIYTFDTDPYNSTKIPTWGVYNSIPTTSWLDNFQELGINLSTIRLTIGLSF